MSEAEKQRPELLSALEAARVEGELELQRLDRLLLSSRPIEQRRHAIFVSVTHMRLLLGLGPYRASVQSLKTPQEPNPGAQGGQNA